MTAIPKTRYVSTRQGDIAYQVLGEGPIDLLLGSGIGSHLDMYWEVPAVARFFQALASFSRLIMLDPRKPGLVLCRALDLGRLDRGYPHCAGCGGLTACRDLRRARVRLSCHVVRRCLSRAHRRPDP